MKSNSKPSHSGTNALALQILARDFALHCTRLRSDMGLTQSAFAKELGIKNKEGKITVSRWESGRITPYKYYLQKFLKLQNKWERR